MLSVKKKYLWNLYFLNVQFENYIILAEIGLKKKFNKKRSKIINIVVASSRVV